MSEERGNEGKRILPPEGTYFADITPLLLLHDGVLKADEAAGYHVLLMKDRERTGVVHMPPEELTRWLHVSSERARRIMARLEEVRLVRREGTDTWRLMATAGPENELDLLFLEAVDGKKFGEEALVYLSRLLDLITLLDRERLEVSYRYLSHLWGQDTPLEEEAVRHYLETFDRELPWLEVRPEAESAWIRVPAGTMHMRPLEEMSVWAAWFLVSGVFRFADEEVAEWLRVHPDRNPCLLMIFRSLFRTFLVYDVLVDVTPDVASHDARPVVRARVGMPAVEGAGEGETRLSPTGCEAIAVDIEVENRA